MRTIRSLIGSVTAVAVVAAGSAHAQQITSPLEPSLAGATVIDFESAPPGAFTSLTQLGVTFTVPTSGQSGYILNAYSGSYNTSGYSLQNTYNGDAFGLLRFGFASSVSAFGFNWGASDDQWTLNAYDASNNLLASVLPAITYGASNGFTGIQGVGAISYATLSGPRSDYIFVDDFRYVAGATAVPEPASIALVAGGLLALVPIARRRLRR